MCVTSGLKVLMPTERPLAATSSDFGSLALWTKEGGRPRHVNMNGLSVFLASLRSKHFKTSAASKGARRLAEQVRNITRWALQQMFCNLLYKGTRHCTWDAP